MHPQDVVAPTTVVVALSLSVKPPASPREPWPKEAPPGQAQTELVHRHHHVLVQWRDQTRTLAKPFDQSKWQIITNKYLARKAIQFRATWTDLGEYSDLS